MKIVILLVGVVCMCYSALSDVATAESDKMPPLPEGAFTFAVIPDTQDYDGEGFIRIFRFVPSAKVVRCYTIDPRKDGAIVRSHMFWRDSKWFNFELPYPVISKGE